MATRNVTPMPRPLAACFALHTAGRWIAVTRHGPDEYRSKPYGSRFDALLAARRLAALLVRGAV